MRTPYNLPSFYKGQLVGLAPTRPGTNIWGWRQITAAELQAWRDSPASKGYDDAGESKLPPRQTHISCVPGRPYEVVRGRVSASYSYGKRTGCMELQCFATGERFCVGRELFRLFQEPVQPA
jgi:hypothetical protein